MDTDKRCLSLRESITVLVVVNLATVISMPRSTFLKSLWDNKALRLDLIEAPAFMRGELSLGFFLHGNHVGRRYSGFNMDRPALVVFVLKNYGDRLGRRQNRGDNDHLLWLRLRLRLRL